jgi:ABC-type branched-subunit amino acid transport system ATPase component
MTGAALSGLLVVERVSKHFGGVTALDGVSLEVRAGSVVGIIGPNGSGKTTLVNVITGFARPDEGRVWFDGGDVTGLAPHRVAGLGLARTFQRARPFHGLSPAESLVIPLCAGSGRKDKTRGRWGDRGAVALDLLEEVGFERDASMVERPAAALPQGYLRRLELARCLAQDARLIIADELFSGLTHAEATSLVPLIEKLRLEGRAIVLVEHRLRELFAVAHHVVVLHQGAVIASGAPGDIARDARVRETYLGGAT